MKQILILDDDTEITTLTRLILERAGYHPIYTNSSHDALNLLQNNSFDLLIMSSTIADRDWWVFYNYLVKADPTLRKIGVIISVHRIMLTVEEWADSFRKIRDNGDALLIRPPLKEELLDTVKNMLGNGGTELPIGVG